jgi:putative transcriptional regulator
MRRAAAASIVCGALLWTTAEALLANPALPLKAGLLLYAAPGLPDPNFARTVVLLVDHGAQGSLGLVVNRVTTRGLESILDLKPDAPGSGFPVSWGGPVQPEALLALVRSPRPDGATRAIVPGVHLTRDLEDVRAALAERDASLRVRVFSGYAGWDRGQLAAEIRLGSWVLDRADAARVFSPEPSRLWEGVHEILARVQAREKVTLSFWGP